MEYRNEKMSHSQICVDKSKHGRGIKRYDKFFVYIVQCQDGTYYTGRTHDLENRIKEHNNSKRGAKYLRGKLPVRLVWHKRYKYYKRASQAERRLKKLTHNQKRELIKIYEKNQTR